MEGWNSKFAPPMNFYETGTWGPSEAEELIAHDGYHWTHGCGNDTEDAEQS